MSGSRLLAAGALFAVLSITRPSTADPEKEPSLFVQPHTGAFLRLAEKDKRAVGRFAHLASSGFRFDATVSVPLDDETREAALASGSDAAPGFSGRLSIGYDSRKRALALSPQERDVVGLAAGCVLVRGLQSLYSGCDVTEADLRAWYDRYVTAGRAHQKLDCKLPAPDKETAEAKIARESKIQDCLAAEEFLNEGDACTQTPDNICEGVGHVVRHYDLNTGGAAKDLDRFAVPREEADDSAIFVAALLETSYAFDRFTLYKKADLAASPVKRNNYDFEIGPRLDLFVAPAWAFSLTGGARLEHDIDASAVKRCQAFASSDPGVTGQACSDVRVLNSPVSDNWSGYTRLSGMYLVRHVLPNVVPGVEVRAGLEDIGQTAELQFRFTAFLSPVTGPVLSRFGIGTDLSLPVQSNADEGKKSGELRTIRPFLLIGASL